MDVVLFFIFVLFVQAEVKIYYKNRDTDVLPEPRTVKIIVNNNLVFNCSSSHMNSTFEWLKDGQSFYYNAVLNISGVATTDKGNYTCKASGSALTEEKSLIVEILQPPSAISASVPKSVLYGENVSVTASATGNPDPTLEWRKDSIDGELLSGNKTYTFTASNNLTLFCIARNQLTPTFDSIHSKTTSKGFTVVVDIKAKVTPHADRFNQFKPGDILDIKCFGSGVPLPRQWWTKQCNNSFTQSGYRLRIFNVSLGDTGNYTCYAENTVVPANGSHIIARDSFQFTVVVGDTPIPSCTTTARTMPSTKASGATTARTMPSTKASGVTTARTMPSTKASGATTAQTMPSTKASGATTAQTMPSTKAPSTHRTVDTTGSSPVTTTTNASNCTNEPAFAGLLATLCCVVIALVISIIFNIISLRRQSIAKSNETGIAKVVNPVKPLNTFTPDPLLTPDDTPINSVPVPNYTDLHNERIFPVGVRPINVDRRFEMSGSSTTEPKHFWRQVNME